MMPLSMHISPRQPKVFWNGFD